MDRARAWLAVWPLVAAGMLASHWLAYRLTATRADPLHGYLEHAPQLLLVLALVGVGCAGLGSRVRLPRTWTFPLVALAGFVVQEHVERLLHGGGVPWLLASPAFLLGLLLQLPVAVLAWALARRVLEALAELPERPRQRPRPPGVIAAPPAWAPCPAAGPPLPGRGPPLFHRP